MVRSLFALAASAALFALASPRHRAGRTTRDDPEIDGKKVSAWVEDDHQGRLGPQAVAGGWEALAKAWTQNRHEQALFYVGRALRVDTSAAVRTQAALAIGGIRELEIRYLIEKKEDLGVKDLIDAMGTEKESRVRKEIAKSIGRFPVVAKRAVAELTGALKDPEPATPRRGRRGHPAVTGTEGKSAAAGLAPLLADEDKAVRRAAVISLGRIMPEGASTIAETMAKMLATEKGRRHADRTRHLHRVAGREVAGGGRPRWRRSSPSPEDELRRRAVRTLGNFGTAADPAAEALYKIAGHRQTERHPGGRGSRVRLPSSAPAGVKSRVKDMLALLADTEYEVRLAVVEEVGSLGNDLIDDQDTIKVLRIRLSDSHLKVREAAKIALAKIEKKPEPKKDQDPEPKKEP